MMISDLNEVLSLTDCVFKKTSKEEAVWSQFLELFTIEFILDNLDRFSQKRFLQMITEGDDKALSFALSKINNFNNKYTQALADKVLTMLEGEELNAQN